MKKVTCIDIEKNTYEVNINELRWRPSVYAIIIQDSKILLSPQWDGYDLPGGGIDLGESISEALIRETKEETGMDIRPLGIVHVDSNFFKHPNHPDDFIQSILLYYSARITGGALSTEGFDGHEKEYARIAEWIPLSEIGNIKWASSLDIVPIIKKVLS